jgi:hypothetical protein
VAVLVGPLLARGWVSALPFPTDPNDPDALHASAQYDYSAGWRGADRRMEQAGIDNHNLPQDGFSASPESSSEMIDDISSSPSAESEPYAQSEVQDDYADATSFPRGQVEGSTLGLVETQAESVTTQRASRQRQQNIQKQIKKKKDMERKRAQRFDDGQTFKKICELLKISPRPKKDLVRRSE